MEIQKQTLSIDDLSKQGSCIEFFSAYQEMDINRMINLCEPDGEIAFIPLGEAGKGTIGKFGKMLWVMLMDCFPDLDNTVISTSLIGGNSVKCIVSIFGTQAKDFAGIPNKGFRFESDHIFIFRFNAENKISSIQINWDHEGFQRQLGA